MRHGTDPYRTAFVDGHRLGVRVALTIGYLHLTFWKAVLALLLWPYYLGVTFSALH